MRHKSQVSAWALEGNKPLEEVHGHPPDLPDLSMQVPIVLEPDTAILKA